MYYSLKIKADTKASEVIDINPSMLLMFEYLAIPLGLQDKNMEQIAAESGINLLLFLVIANFYNGNYPEQAAIESIDDLKLIIKFLENSHKHYVNEKFPLLTSYIREISKVNKNPEISLLEGFFDKYLEEVAIHLKYENSVVFPYVISLMNEESESERLPNSTYSMSEYIKHHDDIEEKLIDLKNLLVRYLPTDNDVQLRRRLLITLKELETDLHIHSMIEEKLLIPVVQRIEKAITKRR